MSHELSNLIRREHLCLGMELILELAVVDLGVAGSNDQYGTLRQHERKSLGYSFRLAAHSLGSQLNGGAGYIKLKYAVLHAEGLKILSYLFYGHFTILLG